MACHNEFSYGIIKDCITNLCNHFSSYLSVFITLEPIAFERNERNLYVRHFCCFCLLVTESHQGLVPILSSGEY